MSRQEVGSRLDFTVKGCPAGNEEVIEALTQLAQHRQAAAVVAGDLYRGKPQA